VDVLEHELRRDARGVHDPVVAAHLRVRRLGRVGTQVAHDLDLELVLVEQVPGGEGVGEEVAGRGVDEEGLLEVLVVGLALVGPVDGLALLGELERLDVHLAPLLAVAGREVRRVALRELEVVVVLVGPVLLRDLLVLRVCVGELARALLADRAEDLVDLRVRRRGELLPGLVEVARERDDLARGERARRGADLALALRVPIALQALDVLLEAVLLDPGPALVGADERAELLRVAVAEVGVLGRLVARDHLRDRAVAGAALEPEHCGRGRGSHPSIQPDP
jgi:hypothetical protein